MAKGNDRRAVEEAVGASRVRAECAVRARGHRLHIRVIARAAAVWARPARCPRPHVEIERRDLVLVALGIDRLHRAPRGRDAAEEHVRHAAGLDGGLAGVQDGADVGVPDEIQ